ANADQLGVLRMLLQRLEVVLRDAPAAREGEAEPASGDRLKVLHRQSLQPTRPASRTAAASRTPFTSTTAPPGFTLASRSASGLRRYSACATASTTASACGIASQVQSSMPYSCFASPASASG